MQSAFKPGTCITRKRKKTNCQDLATNITCLWWGRCAGVMSPTAPRARRRTARTSTAASGPSAFAYVHAPKFAHWEDRLTTRFSERVWVTKGRVTVGDMSPDFSKWSPTCSGFEIHNRQGENIPSDCTKKNVKPRHLLDLSQVILKAEGSLSSFLTLLWTTPQQSHQIRSFHANQRLQVSWVTSLLNKALERTWRHT